MTSAHVPSLTTTSADDVHHGQARMAYRLAAAYAAELMFVHGIGWHVYDGTRWVEDRTGSAKRAVLAVIRTAYEDSFSDRELLNDVRKSESAAGINGVLDLASALEEFAFTVDQLDPDPYLLNTANGVLDLRTRVLRPHDPRDRMSKVTRGAYHPDADMSVWTGFLEQVMPEAAERSYLQRVVGQSVHGTVREHLFPVLIGTGANGKGTAYGAITNALGDYAVIVNPDLLMVRDRGGVGGPEMMTLLNARLVVGSETEEGRKLDEAVMKRLTGGDEITARRLYQEPVSWRPSHQLVYVTNALPVVKGNDPAVWRRIRVIPFDVVVPVEHRDPLLPETLMLHADAVLTWAIQGFYDYEDNGGMREPASVMHATEGYRTDSDPVARFVAEECEQSPHVHATTRQLHGLWSGWASRDGAEPLSEKAFSAELERLGFEARRTKHGKTWTGLRPLPDTSEMGGGDGW